MNRAMGFGLLAGGIFTGMVAALPSPAAAHFKNIFSPQGEVQVSSDHRGVAIIDPYVDGISVGIHYKEQGSGIVNYHWASDGEIEVFRSDAPITAFRKCQSGGGAGPLACGDWVGA